MKFQFFAIPSDQWPTLTNFYMAFIVRSTVILLKLHTETLDSEN